MFGPWFDVHKVSFLVCNHLSEEGRADCFTCIVLWRPVAVSVLCFFLAMPCVGLGM